LILFQHASQGKHPTHGNNVNRVYNLGISIMRQDDVGEFLHSKNKSLVCPFLFKPVGHKKCFQISIFYTLAHRHTPAYKYGLESPARIRFLTHLHHSYLGCFLFAIKQVNVTNRITRQSSAV